MSNPPLRAAYPQPCNECPWRIENQRKRHHHHFYTLANLRSLWAGLRRGERMTCHPTDPRMAEFSGYEETADRKVTHECTGSLILVQREFMQFQACCEEARQEEEKDGFRRYRFKHPNGLLKQGVKGVLERALLGGRFGDLPMARPDLNTKGIHHPDLLPWAPPRCIHTDDKP